jgi:hypothetical protein
MVAALYRDARRRAGDEWMTGRLKRLYRTALKFPEL